MKALSTLPSILSAITLLFCCTGCNDKPKETLPYEHSVENIPAATPSQNATQAHTGEKNISEENRSTALSPVHGKQFSLGDQNGITHIVSVENDQLFFKDISQPVVILNFFSTWSLPCQGEAPYLADLQKKYPKELSLIGVLLHPDDNLQELEKFIKDYHASYFISSSSDNDRFAQKILERLHMPDILPIPLTVIYYKGHYYRHYEGAVPIEMIEHDIKVLLEE